MITRFNTSDFCFPCEWLRDCSKKVFRFAVEGLELDNVICAGYYLGSVGDWNSKVEI